MSRAKEQRSLFGEILDWMLAPLLLLFPTSVVLTWLVAQGIANKPFDRALVYNVQALAQLVKVGPNHKVQFNLPQPASELLRADDSDMVAYQVLGTRGEFLSGERELPPPPDDERPAIDEVRLRDAELRGLEVLLQRAGRLVSKDQLVERLCEWGEEVSNNAIEVYIHRLRKKIEKGPIRIATVRGLGYCLEKIAG